MAALAITKMEICRYYESSSGCMRGERCYFAHGDGELRRPIEAHFQEELKRKIFIGGLSPSVTSDVLGEFFEIHFGPVKDAVVIGSQAGENIHPRGFGFVTFKNEESVAAAVEIHFVTILGKKVEIKGAVPKSMIGISSAVSSENAASLWKQLQPQPFRQLSVGMALEEADGSRKQLVSWVDKLRDGIPVDAVSNLSKHETPWVRKFVKWLPDFLGEVYKRLKDGECYPLSSLKGDFRATCGMELDHASLGYQKLSDFVRSLTGICRMKIVPVGRGPATHMVLLEPHHRLDRDSRTPTTGFEPEGCDYQSYADALYHGVARHDATSRTSKEETTNLVTGDWFGVAEERGLPSAKMAGAEIAEDENERLLTFLRSDGSAFTPWQPPGDKSTWGRRLSAFSWTFRSYFQTSPRDFLLAKKLEVD
ncbi:uncharacterized protein LOC116253805 [Nymphaea colorata]|uniref:uncharacterized protein LOC116253805 n=1 Tax=Nymphaea colorata TaxID=210225 RepID=UPI00214E6B9E|nr:uncharacterized protein LOC116253805 [Nymphaea colorata]